MNNETGGPAFPTARVNINGMNELDGIEAYGPGMTTDTIKLAIEALESCNYDDLMDRHGEQFYDEYKVGFALATLRAALDSPAKPVDCRGCENFISCKNEQVPATDQADSDRMAAQLLIDSTWYTNCVVACVAGDRHLVESGHRVDHNNTTEDKCRAVREARMLAAVEIGGMK